jgi:hypothetical protein
MANERQIEARELMEEIARSLYVAGLERSLTVAHALLFALLEREPTKTLHFSEAELKGMAERLDVAKLMPRVKPTFEGDWAVTLTQSPVGRADTHSVSAPRNPENDAQAPRTYNAH